MLQVNGDPVCEVAFLEQNVFSLYRVLADLFLDRCFESLYLLKNLSDLCFELGSGSLSLCNGSCYLCLVFFGKCFIGLLGKISDLNIRLADKFLRLLISLTRQLYRFKCL